MVRQLAGSSDSALGLEREEMLAISASGSGQSLGI